MDWKIILQLFMYTSTVIAFCIIKFNDFAHLEKGVNELKQDLKTSKEKQNTRHEENIKTMNGMSNKISELVGKCNAFHSKN